MTVKLNFEIEEEQLSIESEIDDVEDAIEAAYYFFKGLRECKTERDRILFFRDVSCAVVKARLS